MYFFMLYFVISVCEGNVHSPQFPEHELITLNCRLNKIRDGAIII